LKQPLKKEDFKLAYSGTGEAIANVIGIIENQAPTKHLKIQVPVVDGEIKADIAKDVDKIALIDRHHASGKIQVGLVSGFGFNIPCAIGTTVAHDCHQMIIIGTDEEDMAIAANSLAECGGGQVVVSKGKIIGRVELPIAGLMSNEKAEIVAEKAASVLAGFTKCGCKLNNPNMQMSLLGLAVIPELRITDLGLVDVTQFNFIPFIEPIK
jgi:adenine deaminase